MKRASLLAISLVSVFSFLSCVSQSDYENVKAENKKLKADLEALTYDRERIYKTASDYFHEKEYDKAITELNKLFDKHPEAMSDTKFTQLFSKVNTGIEKEKKIQQETRNRLEKELNKNIKKRYDEFQKITWYTTKRNITYYKNNASYDVEVYFGQADGAKSFHLRTEYNDHRSEYHDTTWIFYEEVQLLGTNGTRLTMHCEYPKKQSEVYSGGLKEWCDSSVPENEMLQFENAQSVKVRFDGKYAETFNMTNEQLKALKEIIERYKRT